MSRSHSCVRLAVLLLALVLPADRPCAGTPAKGAQTATTYDVVVYGGTSAAVVAAVQARRMGKSVAIVSPDRHLGGLSSGGLGFTDTGNKAVIGGLSREFYHRVWRHYEGASAWRWQKREEYGNRGQGTPAIDREQRTMWIFEPHVAEQVFEDLIREHDIPVHRNEWLNRATGVRKDGARIASITTLGGKTYRAKMFIDATYEGDLMAAARVYAAGWRETFDKFDPVPNRKTDSNNHGPFSTDNIGMNYDYPEASYERRREILKEHERYQKGWLYFVANDPRVPDDVRKAMSRWGLPKDEFRDNGGWPHQIYVREARRMIGTFVMTENELMRRRPTPESIGMGSYGIDSHNVQRYITPDGAVQNEGDIGVPLPGPYAIAFGAILPRRGQADNLLVPVCVSSSHIAFGSIRMEPVFMVLGQSAATAAALAIDAGAAVQDVPYARLRERLLKDGQVLEYR